MTIAQGGSLARLAKPYMTSREAHLFLSAPEKNRVHENVWWAKLKAVDLPNDAIKELIDRIFTYQFFADPSRCLAEAIRFFGRFYPAMDKTSFGEITDCLAWKLRNEPAFGMRGRTLSSMMRITKEWHVEMQQAKLRTALEWPGTGITDWSFETKDQRWTIAELRTNIELLNEGRTQKHCVFAYVPRCESGQSAIFSMRGYAMVVSERPDDDGVHWNGLKEHTRVTIEVNRQRNIIQVRGYCNRSATVEERRLIRTWALEKRLTLPKDF